MSEGLTDHICGTFAVLRPEDVPGTAMIAARHVLLDAVGVMLGASGMAPEVAPFVTVAKANGAGPATILGTGVGVTPAMAALANGAMAHALDYEDAFDRKPGHPNASLVPALLALAQAEGSVDGTRFLAALAVGCDLSCRLGLALRQDMEVGGWYPPPILAGFGATLGAAKLLGLDAVRMRDALSLALCQVTMPGVIKHSRDTVIRAVREAFPAQAAVLSAMLAREGVAGFEEPLAGRDAFYALYAAGQFDPAELLDGLGQSFLIEQLTFKPWPSCRGTHPFIEMALDLRARHGLTPADIAAVEVRVDAVQQMLVEPLERKQAPQTLIDAKFSILFATAVALARGRVDLDTLDAAALADAEVLRLAARTTATLPDAPTWRKGAGGELAIRLRDGTLIEARVEEALGCPARPLDETRLVAKFVDCAGRARNPLARPEAERLAEAILSLETCADVGALFA